MNTEIIRRRQEGGIIQSNANSIQTNTTQTNKSITHPFGTQTLSQPLHNAQREFENSKTDQQGKIQHVRDNVRHVRDNYDGEGDGNYSPYPIESSGTRTGHQGHGNPRREHSPIHREGQLSYERNRNGRSDKGNKHQTKKTARIMAKEIVHVRKIQVTTTTEELQQVRTKARK